MRRCHACLFIVASVLGAAGASAARRERIPRGMLVGFTSPGKAGTDDEGPPRKILDRLYRQSHANLYFAGCTWDEIEPAPPSDDGSRRFDWSSLDEGLRTVPQGCWTITKIRLGGNWAESIRETDPDRYWRLAEGYVEAAARRTRAVGGPRACFFQAPGNEPSLTMRPDWAERHMEPIRHYYRAIKSASPGNKLIAGALVVGDRPRVEALYKAGLKDHYDVLDIHAYGDERTHVDIDQVIETHQVMVEHGDGHKKIFLGEGWACFPLPKAVDRMNTEGPRPYMPDEVEHYWKSLVRGYYHLITPRATYDPDWVLGARYFTMNDFWGSLHWRERAKPVYNEAGELDHYVLDGYYVPNEPGVLEPKYRPWGLVDAEGRPKGDLIFEFPPYIPCVELHAVVIGIPSDRVLIAGRPYDVVLEVHNRDEQPIDDLRTAMGVDEKDHRGAFTFAGIDPLPADRIDPGSTARARFRMTAGPALSASGFVRALGELDYRHEGRNYYADAWIEVGVRPVARLQTEPAEVMAPATAGDAMFAVRVATEFADTVEVPLRVEAPPELAASPSETRAAVRAGEETSATFRVRLAPPGGPGIYTVRVESEPGVEPAVVSVAFPKDGWRRPASVPGVLHNGGFEDLGPGSGFYAWQGDPSNWTVGDALDELPEAGERCVSYASDGVTFDRRLVQRVPLGAEHAGREAIVAAMFKGTAHSGAKDVGAVQCRLLLRALDPHGHELAKAESLWFKADGGWDRIERRLETVPNGSAELEIEFRLRNREASAWHHAYLDRAALTWGQTLRAR